MRGVYSKVRRFRRNHRLMFLVQTAHFSISSARRLQNALFQWTAAFQSSLSPFPSEQWKQALYPPPLQIYLHYFGCRNKGMCWEAMQRSQSSYKEDSALEVGEVPCLTPEGGFLANKMCRGRGGTDSSAWQICQPSLQHLGKMLNIEWWWYLISDLTCFGSCLLSCWLFWVVFPGTDFKGCDRNWKNSWHWHSGSWVFTWWVCFSLPWLQSVIPLSHLALFAWKPWCNRLGWRAGDADPCHCLPSPGTASRVPSFYPFLPAPGTKRHRARCSHRPASLCCCRITKITQMGCEGTVLGEQQQQQQQPAPR